MASSSSNFDADDDDDDDNALPEISGLKVFREDTGEEKETLAEGSSSKVVQTSNIPPREDTRAQNETLTEGTSSKGVQTSNVPPREDTRAQNEVLRLQLLHLDEVTDGTKLRKYFEDLKQDLCGDPKDFGSFKVRILKYVKKDAEADLQQAYLFLPVIAGGRKLNLILRSWDLYIIEDQALPEISGLKVFQKSGTLPSEDTGEEKETLTEGTSSKGVQTSNAPREDTRAQNEVLRLPLLNLDEVTDGTNLRKYFEELKQDLCGDPKDFGGFKVRILKYVRKVAQADIRQAFLFLPIIAGGRKLNLILRSWDLYIIGFQGEDQVCRYLVNNDMELFQRFCEAYGLKSEKIGLGDNYRDLENAANVRRSKIRLGRQHVMDAVRHLATPYGNKQNPAPHILMLSQAIPEVLRSRVSEDFFINQYTANEEKGDCPTDESLILQQGWGLGSDKLLRSLHDGADFDLYYDENTVVSMDYLRDWIGICKNTVEHASSKAKPPYYNLKKNMKKSYLNSMEPKKPKGG